MLAFSGAFLGLAHRSAGWPWLRSPLRCLQIVPLRAASRPRTTGRKRPANFVQPPLLLAVDGLPAPEATRLRVITADGPHDRHVYPLAAFAWHYGHRLDPVAQRALLSALLMAWPRKSGNRPKEAYADRLTALAAQMGISQERIADAWFIEPDSARKKIDRGRAATRSQPQEGAAEISFTWSINIVADDHGRSSDGDDILSAPQDPGDEDALVRALGAAPDWSRITREERRAAIERLATALDDGDDSSVVTLLLTNGDTLTLELPRDPKAAWSAIDRAARERGSEVSLMQAATPSFGFRLGAARVDDSADK